MRKLIAVICFMLGTSPLTLAQDKGEDNAKITVKPGLPAGVTAASIASGAPVVAPAGVISIPAGAASAGTTAAPAAKKSTKTAGTSVKAKKQPSEKQKARQAKMKSCSKDASDKKLKSNERKKFMSGCMSAQPKVDLGTAPAKK